MKPCQAIVVVCPPLQLPLQPSEADLPRKAGQHGGWEVALPLAIQARRLMPLPIWPLLSGVAWAALMTSYCTPTAIEIRQQQSDLYQ